VCRGNKLNAINLYSTDSGVDFYKKKGFENVGDVRFPNKMMLILLSGTGARKTRKYRLKRK
jgi:hypothetical protein